MQATHSREPLLTDIIASLITFVISATTAALVLSETFSPTIYILSHIGCAAIAALIALQSGTPPRRQAILHVMMATALGPIGSAGTFLCATFEFCFRPFASPFSEWFESIFPENEKNQYAAFVDLLYASEDPVLTSRRVTSFRDTLTSGTIEQKQALIGLIARRFTPAFAPALREALHDPVPAVRVQAAAAAASIEGKYADHTYRLTERIKRNPTSLEDQRAIANHFVEFGESGIAEEQRSSEARNAALTHFDRILQSHPNDIQALSTSAKLLLLVDRAADANDRIKRAMTIAGVSAADTEIQMEALIQLGRFQELRASASKWSSHLSKVGREDQRIQSALQLWASGSSHA